MNIEKSVTIHHSGVTRNLPTHEVRARQARVRTPSLATGPFKTVPAATRRVAALHLHPSAPAVKSF